MENIHLKTQLPHVAIWEERDKDGEEVHGYNHRRFVLLFLPEVIERSPLGPPSFVLLLLHVSARHPLPALRQPPTAGAVFTCPEAALMVAGVAFWKGRRDTQKKTVISS